MPTKPTKKKAASARPSTVIAAAQQQRDELRRLKTLHNTIGNLTRGIVRAQDAADRRLATLVAVYADRLDKVLVDRAAWNTLREEVETLREAVKQSAQADAARARELTGAHG